MDWIDPALLGVVFGAAGSLFGVMLTNKSNHKQLSLQLQHAREKDAERVRQEKMEELYVLVSEWSKGMFVDYLNRSLVMKGEIDYNTYLDRFIEYGKDNKHEFARFQMLVEMYANDLKTDYDQLMGLRTQINELTSEHTAAYKSGKSGFKYLPQYSQLNIELEEASDALCSKIAEKVRS